MHHAPLQKYFVEKKETSLTSVLRVPVATIACIVISWSLSLVTGFSSLILVSVISIGAYMHAWNTVVEEKLLVASSLGIQIEQTNILGKLKYAKFVPIENIKAVVINEIIRRQRVIAYLLIILEAPESTGKTLVPLLIGTLPRLRTIETIYAEIQRSIFQ